MFTIWHKWQTRYTDMTKRGRLWLTAEQIVFATFLCRELNSSGVPVEYGAFKIAIANWWIGNAAQNVPGDNDQLMLCMSRAITAWTTKARPIDDLPGFIIMEMKIFAASRPLSSQPRTGGGETALADKIQAWCRKAIRSSETEV